MPAALAVLFASLLDLSAAPGNNCLPAVRRHAPDLLEKYRYPRDADLEDYWDFYIQEYGEVPFCDAGDLNGDGVVDYLAVLLPRQPPGVLVVAMVSSEGGARSAQILFESSSKLPAPNDVVVDVVPSVIHKTLCAYRLDDAAAATVVTLQQSAGRLRTRISRDVTSHRVFVWGAESKEFREVELCK